jgi:hypothetical protein
MMKCSAFSAIKVMQVKMTLRFPLIQLQWQTSRKQTTTNAGEDAGRKEVLHTVGRNVN